jgi:O-antigen/teichoic acid export membrane protein
MALTVVGGLRALTATKLDISVINTHFKDDVEFNTHLNTIWTLDLLRGFLLTCLLLVTAYPMSLFYSDGRLYTILLLISLTPLIQGFNNVGLLIHRKKVAFQRIALLELATNILSDAVLIALALWIRNVWVLVIGQLVTALVGMALSYVAHPYRPRPALDKEAAMRAFGFGKYAVLGGVVYYVMTMTDNILIGKLFGVAVLGTYVIAYNLASLPVYVLGVIVANVTWPAYAEISGGNNRQLGGAFIRVLACASALLAMATALLMLLGDEIVTLFYGDQWKAAGTALRILSLLVFCRGHAALITPLIRNARGMASEARIKVVEAGIFLALLYPFTSRYGAAGAAGVGAVAYLITMINRVRFAQILLPHASKTILRILLSATTATGLGLVLGAAAIFAVKGVIARLLLGGAVVSIVVWAAMLSLSPPLRSEFLEIYSTLGLRKIDKERQLL